MVKRYKLARICRGRYLSANSYGFQPDEFITLEYKVGAVTECGNLGVACYKARKYTDTPDHIDETMKSFNRGKPIAVLELEPVGEPVYRDCRYGKGGAYEGGVNYRAVKVIRIVKVIKAKVRAI